MRVLFVAEQFEPDIGGLATSGTRIAKTLARSGHHVEVFVLSKELETAVVDSTVLNGHLTVHRFGRSSQQDFSLQQSLIFLEWLHAREPFDVVWSHYAMNSGFTGIWFARSAGIQSVVSVRGNDLDRQLFPPGDLSRLVWMLENATTIVSVSHDLANKIETLCGRQAVVLHNSVDTTLFSPGDPDLDLIRKYGLKPEEMVLVFSGELRAKKGLPMLIECFRRVASSRPARLLVIGQVRAKDRGIFAREVAGLTVTNFDPVQTSPPSSFRISSDNRVGDIEDKGVAFSSTSGTGSTCATDKATTGAESTGGVERTAGADGTLDAKVRERKENVGAVIVTGHLDQQKDVAQHLRLGDVFVLPSLWDGLPNSLLESMSAGLPVVASDAGAICEVVTDRENGMIVPRAHLHRMALRIDEFFSKPAKERKAIVGAARKFVEDNHAPADEVTKLNDILNLTAKPKADG